jgi:hypothetical protein
MHQWLHSVGQPTRFTSHRAPVKISTLYRQQGAIWDGDLVYFQSPLLLWQWKKSRGGGSEKKRETFLRHFHAWIVLTSTDHLQLTRLASQCKGHAGKVALCLEWQIDEGGIFWTKLTKMHLQQHLTILPQNTEHLSHLVAYGLLIRWALMPPHNNVTFPSKKQEMIAQTEGET